MFLSFFKLLWGFFAKLIFISGFLKKFIFSYIFTCFFFSIAKNTSRWNCILTGLSVRRHVLCGYPTFINAKIDHLVWIRHPSIIKSPIDLSLVLAATHACLDLLTIPRRVVKWSFWTSIIPSAFISFVSFPLSIFSMNLCPSNLLRWSMIIPKNRYWILHTCVLTHCGLHSFWHSNCPSHKNNYMMSGLCLKIIH